MRVGESFCPGILHAVPAKDGMLIRVRVPGGFLRAGQFGAVAAIATAFADGQIEITSRANLQLRAIGTQNIPLVIEALTLAGLLPSSQHDRVRNIVTSPLTGLTPDELIDSRPHIRELDERLMADMLFVKLHPKFSFAIDGGGKRFSRETDDLALRALSNQAIPLLQLFIAGIDTGFAVPASRSVDCLLEAARVCIQLAKQFGVAVRGKEIVAIPGALESVMQALSHLLVPSTLLGISPSVDEAPLGIYPEAEAHHVSIIPSVPLGRLTSKQAKRISDTAAECGADLRLAPWRGVVLGAVPERLAASVAAQLESVALRCDGRDGFHGIAACVGSTGCDASLADVRNDAISLAQHLAGRDLKPRWTVNFSGCEKQCAMRHSATAELIAYPSGYSLRINGQLASAIQSPESALKAILSAHAEVAS